jgi:uncharacterized protein YdaU (DUF1376 family)
MHLTQGQHGAFMLLLRWIYTSGKKIPHQGRYRVAMATLPAEEENTDFILAEFFTRDGDGWVNKTASEIIKDADERHKKQVESGRKGAKARYSNPNREPIANHNHNHNHGNYKNGGGNGRGRTSGEVVADFIEGERASMQGLDTK